MRDGFEAAGRRQMSTCGVTLIGLGVAFDAGNTVTLTGTLTKIEWTPPK